MFICPVPICQGLFVRKCITRKTSEASNTHPNPLKTLKHSSNPAGLTKKIEKLKKSCWKQVKPVQSYLPSFFGTTKPPQKITHIVVKSNTHDLFSIKEFEPRAPPLELEKKIQSGRYLLIKIE